MSEVALINHFNKWTENFNDCSTKLTTSVKCRLFLLVTIFFLYFLLLLSLPLSHSFFILISFLFSSFCFLFFFFWLYFKTIANSSLYCRKNKSLPFFTAHCIFMLYFNNISLALWNHSLGQAFIICKVNQISKC